MEDADKLQDLMLAVKRNVDMNEPGCHTYRLTRFESRFMVFEE